MVERFDRMWYTGEGNGKPLQYSCLEKPMNSIKGKMVFWGGLTDGCEKKRGEKQRRKGKI